MVKVDKINYSCFSGFLEFFFGEKCLESYLMDIICKVFECYGFIFIEILVVECLEVL